MTAASDGSFELAIAPDQRVGRAVVLQLGLRRALELRNDVLGERLTQFDTPLIKRINLPDRSLGEDAVLVQRNQLSECGRCQCIQQEGVRGTVTVEQPMRYQPIRRAFRL